MVHDRLPDCDLRDLARKRVFVAGGAGFIGSAVVRELLKTGATVISYDNYFHGSRENLAGFDHALTILEGDGRDESNVHEAVQTTQPDFIINCIGDTYVPTAYRNPQRFFDINVGCSLNILRAAKRCSVARVVYVSSTEVYGSVGPERITETYPLNPVNTYAVSKVAADRLCYTYYLEHQQPVVIARIFNCYGPRATHPYVIPEIIAQLGRGSTLTLGNLQARRDFTYVDDTARALIALLGSPIRDGDAINIGSDVVYTVEWLAHAIASEMGINDLEIRSEPHRFRRHDIDCFRCDNRKAQQLAGWLPRIPIAEGIRRTVEWYIDAGRRWSWEKRTEDVLLKMD